MQLIKLYIIAIFAIAIGALVMQNKQLSQELAKVKATYGPPLPITGMRVAWMSPEHQVRCKDSHGNDCTKELMRLIDQMETEELNNQLGNKDHVTIYGNKIYNVRPEEVK